MVKQHSCTRSTLAVDELHVLAQQVLQRLNVLRIALWNHESLAAVHEAHEHNMHAMRLQQPLDIVDVVLACTLIQQM